MSEIIQHKTVYDALAALQAECPNIHKTKRHAQGYTYATLEDWIDTVAPLLAKHGLSLVVSFTEASDVGDYQTKGGIWSKVRVTARADLALAGGDDQQLTVTFWGFGEGADPADKAIYKAMTGARKYLYAAISGSMTTDDPESDTRDSDRVPRTSAPPQQRQQPTPPPAAAAPPAPAQTAPPADGTVTLGQAQDLWKLFRLRVKEVAPGLTKKEDVENEFRKVLKAVANVASAKLVPARLFTTFANVIKGWTPEGEDDPNWGPPPS